MELFLLCIAYFIFSGTINVTSSLSPDDAQPQASISAEKKKPMRDSLYSASVRKASSEVPTTFRGQSLKRQVQLIYEARKMSSASQNHENANALETIGDVQGSADDAAATQESKCQWIDDI